MTSWSHLFVLQKSNCSVCRLFYLFALLYSLPPAREVRLRRSLQQEEPSTPPPTRSVSPIMGVPSPGGYESPCLIDTRLPSSSVSQTDASTSSNSTRVATPPAHPVLVDTSNSSTTQPRANTESPVRRPRPRPRPVRKKPQSNIPSNDENQPPASVVSSDVRGAKDGGDVMIEKTPISANPVDRDAPPWFAEAVECFMSGQLGEEWIECVRLWVDFEKRFQFGENEKKVGFPTVHV